jgi:hypothetical protein
MAVFLHLFSGTQKQTDRTLSFLVPHHNRTLNLWTGALINYLSEDNFHQCCLLPQHDYSRTHAGTHFWVPPLQIYLIALTLYTHIYQYTSHLLIWASSSELKIFRYAHLLLSGSFDVLKVSLQFAVLRKHFLEEVAGLTLAKIVPWSGQFVS